ncbi:uncharacterized protein LOC134815892 isoform X2 [Bolinopsis microptera]|uniref:uncharacterized protein LOC134815892 isoform X2 n=1 Tax=Bolinopsis microptera TaxID=2820187 RepID=UPI003078F62F
MTSEGSGGCSSGDWSLVDVVFKKTDELHSDIEVISNPPSESDPVVNMEDVLKQPPRLLYSEVVQKPPVFESDIEFVPEPLTPELEFDDEEYLNEVLKAAKVSSESSSESDDETCCFPANIHEMNPAMTDEEMEEKEVVLEVNLTLLSFTIIVGVSGMSGFLLGGIYSAVLTNNITHTTDLAEYPGILPRFLYSDPVTCPLAGCESRLFRVEENMKHLKNTLSHDVRDCHEKLKRVEKQNSAKELENVQESQVADSSAKINYLKERNSKHYFKNIAEKYSNMLEIMERKYIKTKSRQQQLGQEFEELKTLASEMELNLEACSNDTIRAENKAQNAMKSKQYVESMLINRISNDKEAYKSLKEMYQNQKNIISEMETQRSTLQESLVRKISSNRKKFLAAKLKLENTLVAVGANKKNTSSKYDLKSKVGKCGEQNEIKEELDESKVVIAEYQEQMEVCQSYIKQIETNLLKLREDVIMREAIQREYVLSLSREHQAELTSIHAHYKSLSNASSDNLSLKSDAYETLKKEHDEIVGVLKEKESYGRYWKDAAKLQQHQAHVLSSELESCRSGKVIAISEYKQTTEMLLELIQGVASRPKVAKKLKEEKAAHDAHIRSGNVSLLKQIFNSTSSAESELETCYSTISTLFPGIQPHTLADVINMTQSRDQECSRKMSSALEKYWGKVDKTYSKLHKKRLQSDEDEGEDEDWYFKRFKSTDNSDAYPRGASRREGKAYYSRVGREDWYLSGRDRKGHYSYVNKQRTNRDNKNQKCEL